MAHDNGKLDDVRTLSKSIVFQLILIVEMLKLMTYTDARVKAGAAGDAIRKSS